MNSLEAWETLEDWLGEYSFINEQKIIKKDLELLEKIKYELITKADLILRPEALEKYKDLIDKLCYKYMEGKGISYTKKYYEIYHNKTTKNECGVIDGNINKFLTVVETKEVAEDFCKRHENCTYKEYSVQVATGSCTSGSCVLD